VGKNVGFLKAVAEASAAQDAVLGGLAPDVQAAEQITPVMVEIVRRLQATPLLVVPTLEWIKQKEAELANAQLSVLYTPEELKAMRAAMGGPAEAATDAETKTQ
jgi:hypothetical protein